MARVALRPAASMDSLLSDTDLDIVTLLSVGQEESVAEISHFHHHHGVAELARREKIESPLLFANVFAHFANLRKEGGYLSEDCLDAVELRGSDVGEADVKYQVKGLRTHEMPVIGVYIDQRISQGFKYRVRHLGRQDCFQFGGAALRLTRIGQGYGKRLTFDAEYRNINPNYFYTDTYEAGFAFGIIAVENGQKFTLWDSDERAIGHAMVLDVNQQQVEIASEIVDKTLTKRVVVAMKVHVCFTSRRHGMMPPTSEDTINVCGLAELEKTKGKTAFLKCVRKIELPMYGECQFYPSSN